MSFRPVVIAVAILILGQFVPQILERHMKDAPDWFWDAITWLCVVAAIIITILWEPIYVRFLGDAATKLSSTAIFGLAAFVIVSSGWWLLIAPLVGIEVRESPVKVAKPLPQPENTKPQSSPAIQVSLV